MNGRTDLEAELEERLEHRAAQLQVKTRPRLEAALHRRARARRVRNLTAGLATASLAGVMTIAVFGVLRGATTAVVTTFAPAAAPAQTLASLGAAVVTTIGRSTTTVGGTSAAAPLETVPPVAVGASPSPTVAAPPSPLPRFLVEVAGAHIVAVSTDQAAPADARFSRIQLQVYRAAGSYSPPVVAVETIPADVDFGLGEHAPAEIMDEVYVHGLTGYLVDDPTLLSASLGWRQGDGTGVIVQGVGIGGQELHEIAQNFLPDANGALRPTSLPYGLTIEPAYDGPLYVPSQASHVAYSSPAVEIGVWDGGLGAFEQLAFSHAGGADKVEVITARGQPALLFGYGEGDFVLIWADRGGTVAVELWLGVSREDVQDVVDALVEVDEATWQATADAAMLAANAGTDTTVEYVSEG